jgi:hypothetical protein
MSVEWPAERVGTETLYMIFTGPSSDGPWDIWTVGMAESDEDARQQFDEYKHRALTEDRFRHYPAETACLMRCEWGTQEAECIAEYRP